jgi:hypothetical protein
VVFAVGALVDIEDKVSAAAESDLWTGNQKTICIADYTGVTLGALGRTLAMRIPPASITGLLLESDTGSVNNSIPR